MSQKRVISGRAGRPSIYEISKSAMPSIGSLLSPACSTPWLDSKHSTECSTHCNLPIRDISLYNHQLRARYHVKVEGPLKGGYLETYDRIKTIIVLKKTMGNLEIESRPNRSTTTSPADLDPDHVSMLSQAGASSLSDLLHTLVNLSSV